MYQKMHKVTQNKRQVTRCLGYPTSSVGSSSSSSSLHPNRPVKTIAGWAFQDVGDGRKISTPEKESGKRSNVPRTAIIQAIFFLHQLPVHNTISTISACFTPPWMPLKNWREKSPYEETKGFCLFGLMSRTCDVNIRAQLITSTGAPRALPVVC